MIEYPNDAIGDVFYWRLTHAQAARYFYVLACLHAGLAEMHARRARRYARRALWWLAVAMTGFAYLACRLIFGSQL